VRALGIEARDVQAVANWIGDRAKEGVQPQEFGVFVRSEADLDGARAAVATVGFRFRVLDERVESISGQVSTAWPATAG
jgi:hypothetical protein